MDGQEHPGSSDISANMVSGDGSGSRKATHSDRNHTDGGDGSKRLMNMEGEDVEDNMNVKGEKTIVCWNCQTVLMVKEDWNVVQCTNCDKINRIPNAPTDVNNQIRINDNLNHFDLYLPYVFIIITCPFCKTDNKARRDAEHVVCFKCHNSTSILKEPKISSGPTSKPAYPNTGQYLPQKSLRMSDMMYPDPMFYPGYYPNSGVNYLNQFYNPAYLSNVRSQLVNQFDDEFESIMSDYNRKMAKLEIMKNEMRARNFESQKREPVYPKSNRFSAAKALLEVVDDDTPMKRFSKMPSNGYINGGNDYGYGKRNSINKMMFDSERRNGGGRSFNENYGPDPYLYNRSRPNLSAAMPPRKDNFGGGFNFDDFVMGSRKF